MKSSKFKKDIQADNWFSSILDRDFYPEFIARLNRKWPDNNFSFKRITDEERQFQGIDLIISDSKTSIEYLIDQKAQLNYRDKKLPTFTFELSYLKDGRNKIGWFLDSKKKTTQYFLFRHIFVSQDYHLESCLMDSIIVEKLKVFLSKFGLNDEFLLEIIDNLDQSLNLEDDLFKTNNENRYGFKILPQSLNKLIILSISPQLAERPVNLLIYLDRLKAMEPNLFEQHNYPFPS